MAKNKLVELKKFKVKTRRGIATVFNIFKEYIPDSDYSMYYITVEADNGKVLWFDKVKAKNLEAVKKNIKKEIRKGW